MKAVEALKSRLTSVIVAVALAGFGVVPLSAEEASAPGQQTSAKLGIESLETLDSEAAQKNLEEAPGRIVSTVALPAENANLTAAANEILKLAQAGVDEGVMLSFVTNSQFTFNLTADDIIYLHDIGVPEAVVLAMIQHDAAHGIATTLPPESSALETNQIVPAGAPTPYPVAEAGSEVTEDIPTVVANPNANVSYTYFYQSLAPYGNWIDVDGYGLCWQPTVVLINRDWRPYYDRGRWTYSDAGWYWASDYTWGWAPFHYGRWFNHRRWGWCWAPDTVWGPSWVTWRYTSDYCGWAPLPPTACYRPGFGFTYFGRSVGTHFSFGLSFNHFSFVHTKNFCDRRPSHHRVHRDTLRKVFDRSVAANHISQGHRNRVMNHGIPVSHVKAVTRADIKPLPIREARSPWLARAERHGRGDDRSLPVFRPELPPPSGRANLVGQGVKPANPEWRARQQVALRREGGDFGRRSPVVGRTDERENRGAAPQPFAPRDFNLNRRSQQPETPPSVRPQRGRTDASERENAGAGAVQPTRRTEPLILRGPNASSSQLETRSTQPSRSTTVPWMTPRQRDAGAAVTPPSRTRPHIPDAVRQPAAPSVTPNRVVPDRNPVTPGRDMREFRSVPQRQAPTQVPQVQPAQPPVRVAPQRPQRQEPRAIRREGSVQQLRRENRVAMPHIPVPSQRSSQAAVMRQLFQQRRDQPAPRVNARPSQSVTPGRAARRPDAPVVRSAPRTPSVVARQSGGGSQQRNASRSSGSSRGDRRSNR